MARIDDLLAQTLKRLPGKSTHLTPPAKKAYSEKISAAVALALADELRHRGLKGARPVGPDEAGRSGAERRMSGGLGAKKVDVTWATETDGLLLAISVKTINFKDEGTGNYQKNLTNRRSDMLMEAVTLHRRFPYAVLAGSFFLDSLVQRCWLPPRCCPPAEVAIAARQPTAHCAKRARPYRNVPGGVARR
jgi:hypothetical protein